MNILSKNTTKQPFTANGEPITGTKQLEQALDNLCAQTQYDAGAKNCCHERGEAVLCKKLDYARLGTEFTGESAGGQSVLTVAAPSHPTRGASPAQRAVPRWKFSTFQKEPR